MYAFLHLYADKRCLSKVLIFFVLFCFFVNNKPLKYREKIKELLPFTYGLVSVSCKASAAFFLLYFLCVLLVTK